ncbi:sialin-like [Schistocerca piceifrons]|uniref:sialin-like n=1 Tax=Schistocerca piceifrons TaxID=274613 RepID=UPI001F5FF1F0|nr:sialin-like [Schistocerca piceifrons]
MTTEPATRLQDSQGLWKSRYTLALLCMLGLAVKYAIRVNISVAIVDMVNQTALLESGGSGNDSDYVAGDPLACPGELAAEGVDSRKEGYFVWDKHKQGEILAAFYYGYTVGHLPGGVLADRFGGKLIFGIGIFLSSLLTVLTPASAWAGDHILFVNRLGVGLFQGGIVPTVQTLICSWAPDHERSRFSIVFLGMYWGIVASMAATGALCETAAGWPLAFYVFGGLGLLWCVPWYLLVADSPARHPRIDPAERRYIEASIVSSARKKLPVPWRSVISTPAVWAMVAFLITFDWSFYLLITSLPLYLANIMHFDMHSNGLLSAIPHITGGVGSLLFGWLADFVFRKGYVSKITGFRLINAIGLLGPAAALVVVALVGCDTAVIVVMLALSGFCMATNCSGFYMNMQAIAPNYAGTIVGVVNTFGNLSGIIVPYVVGAFTNANQKRSAWNAVFYLSAALSAAGYVAYAVFTTAEEQPWNTCPSGKESKAKSDGSADTATIEDEVVEESGHKSLDF